MTIQIFFIGYPVCATKAKRHLMTTSILKRGCLFNHSLFGVGNWCEQNMKRYVYVS